MRRPNSVVAVYHCRDNWKGADFGGHRPPLQKGASCALLFLLVFLLAFAPVIARAQTNTADAPATPTTTAPADAATATPPAVPNAAPVVAPPQGMASPQQQDIEDIRPPFFFLRSWFWFWIVLAVLATIAWLVLLYFWLRPQHQLSAKSAYDLTLEKLEKARAMLREDNAMPYAIFVSETIRAYLGQRFRALSSVRTTEEFLRDMEADKNTPLADHRDLLREFLQSCDLVKFARYQPTLSELERVQQRAQNFVLATKPVPLPARQNGRYA